MGVALHGLLLQGGALQPLAGHPAALGDDGLGLGLGLGPGIPAGLTAV